jgi:hypothetical protein
MGLAAALSLTATVAYAQSWRAVTDIISSSPASCPKVSLAYEMTLQGDRLHVKTPAGKTYDGTVAPDGSVRVEYQGVSRVGKVSIFGNVRSRQLELTASSMNNCHYALKASAAAAGTHAAVGADWAIGRWDGTLSVAGTSAGTSGLRSEPRSMIVRKNTEGGLVCFWNFPDQVEHTPTQSCTIGKDTISLVTIAGSVVDLSRSGIDGLSGTFRNQEWDSQGFRTQVFMKRRQ